MTTESWRDMADKYGKTIEEVKDLLPIEWVVAIAADVHLVENGEGRSIGLCPFHDDNEPSLDVYGNGERWGCFACPGSRGGDVFDFIGDYWQLSEFGARFEKSLELLQAFEKEADDWHSIITRAEPVEPVTVAVLQGEVQTALAVIEQETTKPLRDLLEKKGLSDINLDWLRKEWRLGVNSMGEVVAPYWDREDNLIAYKTRAPQRGGWFARRGVKLTSLYGEWQLTGPNAEADVWLCEGETDTWLASWLLRGRGIALGLPAGAGSRISDEMVELMRGRRVTLLMDADTAGRGAALRWWTQTESVAREVLITFPESDLCDSRNPMTVLEGGKIVPPRSGFVVERQPDGDVYVALTPQGQPGAMVSNFVFHPVKHITYLDTHGVKAMDGFEGRFADETFHARRITTTHFESGGTMGRWANAEGRAWYSPNRKHVQGVFDQLKAAEPFLKEEVAVPVAGLWGEDTANPVFVLPAESGGVIGPGQGAERWSYAPELSKIEVGSKYHLLDRDVTNDWAKDSVKALLRLNAQDVMTPLVAWMTAVPLRKLVREFPPMAVLGDTGSGKTLMTKAVMQYFWGFQGSEQNLTETTPYAVITQSGGINGLPVWWDEFRRGGRQDTFRRVGQLIRDSWTASVSQRGGMGDDLSKIEQTAAIAPLLLSGEAAMEERSHIDRVVVIRLTKGGEGDLRNPEALDSLDAVIGGGGGGVFGRRLIEWQLRNLDRLRAEIPLERDRQAQGVAVLQWGWDMFCEFVSEEWHIDIKWDLDTTRIAAQREDVAENVEIEALLEAISIEAHSDRDDPVPVAWVERGAVGDEPSVVCFRPRAFYQWARAKGFELPGGVRATKQLLMDRYGWLTKDLVTWKALGGIGGEHRVRGVRLLGVIEAEDAVFRRAQIASLESSMEVSTDTGEGVHPVNGFENKDL